MRTTVGSPPAGPYGGVRRIEARNAAKIDSRFGVLGVTAAPIITQWAVSTNQVTHGFINRPSTSTSTAAST
ncbi:hypothetical protein DFR75_11617 [Nocardia ignorata]|uniref:Uncharacterized protein n=1 Tax=Nocardia ignorata TaxID=145285 RepID=A0A4R6NYH0_NOCIG|nr:hypothetical protein DFR75_11617 [Nocardia ignorata]